MSTLTTRQIMRALKATAAPAAHAAGGFGQAVAPSVSSGQSPLVASYGEWTSGRASGSQLSLPRDPVAFLSGAFGPLAPIQAIPIDSPPPGGERPEPRRFQYPISWNMPMGMPGTEGLGKLANFQTLRTLADLYSVARACIELRKAELRGVGWDIVLTKNAAKANRGSSSGMADFMSRREAAVKFFRRPDPKYSDFSSWFDTMLEEVFVTDSLSLYIQPPLGKSGNGKGLLGSDVAALDLIDGTTIRPLLDIRGGTPVPPNVAFQQYQYGVPRVDMMTLLSGDDSPGEDALVAEYRGDQLMYLPYSQRTWTPYGQAPIERAIIPVMTGLSKQQFQLNFFQEGTIPGLFVSPGDPNMTPAQIRELQDALNALAGDQAWKHKIIVLPGGSRVDPQKPVTLADAFDEILMTQVCMGFSVMPMELGISPRTSTTQSTGAANQMAKACYTDDVEVLTRAGWKHFRDVDIATDEFATRHPKTHAFEWQQATAYHEYDHSGPLVKFSSVHGRQDKSDGLHLVVTPNHRMLTVEPISKSKPVAYREYIREAGKISAKRISIPLTSTWEGSGPQSVRFGSHEWAAADFAAFLGAYIAEGHLRRQRGYYKRGNSWVRRPEGHVVKQICISQQQQSKGYEAYRELLTRMLGREPGYNHGTFYFACSELWDYLDELGHANAKYIPASVKDWSAPVLSALLDHYLLGDGYLENGSWRAKTVSRRLADDLQEVAQKLGMSATISERPPRDVMIKGRIIKAENCQLTYLVRFNKSLTRRMTISDVNYTGKVRCVTVPNGIIYVRENGSPAWCGNSQDIQERRGSVPLLLWFKTAIFDHIIQDVCGQSDMEWQWEGLEEDEDAETLTNLLVMQVSAGMRSIDECRQELGLDPWGLPVTSDPGWATQMGGFVSFTIPPPAPPPMPGADQLPPPKPGEQPQPGQLQPSKPQAKPAPAPGQKRPAVPEAGKPRSALSAPASTPAHSAARASTGPSGAGNQPKMQLRELDLLAGYLRKGGTIGAWAFRALPAHVAEIITEDLGKGLTPDEVIGVARGLLVKEAAGHPAAAGLAVLARDTGRVLMLQRARDDTDPASGTWEFPGGRLEPGEDSWAAATREWAEETGLDVPPGLPSGGWSAGEGRYAGHVLVIGRESDLPVFGPRDAADNPDDPDGDHVAALAWWDPAALGVSPVMRRELAAEARTVQAALGVAHAGPGGKGAADDWDPNPVEAEHVASQLRANYPEKAIGWVRSARWIGPVMIPHARVDYDDMARWAASHDKAAVKRFAKRIRAGHPVHPVVAVQEPGENKVKIIDGHHRTLAYRKLGLPVRAYVGFVAEDGGPWDETHSSQRHQGGDPANKAGDAGPKARRRESPGWEHDEALAAAAAAALAAALREAVSSGALARAWVAARSARPGEPAGAWLAGTALAAAVTTILRRVLGKLWRDAWQLGIASAATLLARDPVPGEEQEQALDAMLASASRRADGIAETRMAVLAALLAGVTGSESPADLEGALEDALTGAVLTVITQTEVTWAMALAMLLSYRRAGVSEVMWLTERDGRVCPACLANQAEGFVPTGHEWATGSSPPAHPRCRCALIPA
jgi:8-oxo-dGTP pyrophosphatase MutT (NUDIX family)